MAKSSRAFQKARERLRVRFVRAKNRPLLLQTAESLVEDKNNHWLCKGIYLGGEDSKQRLLLDNSLL